MAAQHRRRPSYRARLVLGVLVASLPVLLVATTVTTWRAMKRLEATSHTFVSARAEHVADDLDRSVAATRASAHFIALEAGHATPDILPDVLVRFVQATPAVAVAETTDLAGQVHLASDSTQAFAPGDQDWFRQAATGKPAHSTPYLDNGQLRWAFAEPILGPDGRPGGVVVLEIKVASLAPLIDHGDFARSGEVQIVDGERDLVLSSRAGLVTGDPAVLTAGALATRVDTPAVRRALGGDTGVVSYVDRLGTPVVAGFAPVRSAGWALVVKESRADAVASSHAQRRLGYATAIGGTLALVVLGLILAHTELKRHRGLADRALEASRELTRSTDRLRNSSHALAAGVSAHSEELTRTSVEADELSRSSASLAELASDVASGSTSGPTILRDMGTTIDGLSHRVAGVEERVNEVGVLVSHIGDDADQTNLISLNAAIEAARAGANGRSFAVLAEEMHRLAERHRMSATDAALLIERTKAETTAISEAVGTAVGEVQRGLADLDRVAEASARTRAAAQSHHSATQQVVDSVGPLAGHSHHTTVVAEGVAAEADQVALLAADLEGLALRTRERY